MLKHLKAHACKVTTLLVALAMPVLTSFSLLFASSLAAQEFPSKPLTLIVPFAPGASADGISRIVARELTTLLGKPVVVENKAGAGGALGLMEVAKSAADGHTFGLGATGAIAVALHLPDAPALKPQQDLIPLGKLADIPLVVVASNASGYGNLQALLRAARSKPGGLSYGMPGQYTAQHLAGELLASLTKMPLTAVAYKGSSPAIVDVLGGTIPAAVVDLTSAYPHIKSGKITAMGVTSATRSKVAPELPTLIEEGVAGYSAPAWMGLFLPSKTPTDVQAKLSAALQKVMALPEVQKQILALAAEPAYLDGPGFQKFIAGESKKWAEIIAKIPPAK